MLIWLNLFECNLTHCNLDIVGVMLSSIPNSECICFKMSTTSRIGKILHLKSFVSFIFKILYWKRVGLKSVIELNLTQSCVRT